MVEADGDKLEALVKRPKLREESHDFHDLLPDHLSELDQFVPWQRMKHDVVAKY